MIESGNGEGYKNRETDESESVNKPSVCAKKVDDERWSFKTKAKFFFDKTHTNVSNGTNLTEKLVLYNNRTEMMCVCVCDCGERKICTTNVQLFI